MNISNITKIAYRKMQDDTSKQIYADRLLYNLTADPSYMKRIIFSIEEYVHLNDVLKKHECQKKIFFGAGWWSSIPRYSLPKFYDTQIFCYVDNFANAKSEYLGLPIISFNELCEKYKDEYIIITGYGPRYEIYNQLISYGFRPENILNLPDIVDKPVKKQYFDCPYFEYDEHEIFVDAGVFDGMTAERFAEWANGKYNHIYGFEPNEAMYEHSKKKYSSLKNATLFKKGVWDKGTFLTFEENGPGSKIVENTTPPNAGGGGTISVVSLDEVLNNDRVTFIKMDVEGAELKALHGAKNLISKYKPKLAISVYHKLTDLWEIPQVILEYNSDYKFYMRHYFFNEYETVLYAF